MTIHGQNYIPAIYTKSEIDKSYIFQHCGTEKKIESLDW